MKIRDLFLERLIAAVCAKILSGIEINNAMLEHLAKEIIQDNPALASYYELLTVSQKLRLFKEAQRWAKSDKRSKEIAVDMKFRLINDIYLPDEDREVVAGIEGEITGFNNYGAICKIEDNSYFVFDGRAGSLEFLPQYRF